MNVATYAFRIVNVFAETPLGGNPLAVFEDARGLDADTMQALALQFNLSETTFLLPSSCASATVRIFTPTFEMPFAGHPTLGSAHVVRDVRGSGDGVTLEMRAGVIPVRADGDRWTLTANAPRHRAPAATHDDVAAMLGLARTDVCDGCGSTPAASNSWFRSPRTAPCGARGRRPRHWSVTPERTNARWRTCLRAKMTRCSRVSSS